MEGLFFEDQVEELIKNFSRIISYIHINGFERPGLAISTVDEHMAEYLSMGHTANGSVSKKS